MNSPSVFQLLPKHILENICHFVMPLSEALKSANPSSVSIRTDLFYSLGPEWKEVALEHYFRHFTITLNCQSSKISSTHPLGNTHVPVEREYRSITTAKVCVALRDILSGDAALTLAQSPYSSFVYSSARILTMEIGGNYRRVPLRRADDLASTPTFYQRLKTMFPNVTRVRISKCAREMTDIISSNCEFEQHLLGLYTKYYDVYSALDLHGSWQGGLSQMSAVVLKMKLFFGDYSEQTFNLIHECAFSLEELVVYNYQVRDAHNIFMDSNGKPVEYTRLKCLKLTMVNGAGRARNDTCVKVLLPSLTHLDVEGGYAFDDDVLFKGASKTLKYANVIVDSHIVTILKKYNVFKGPSYPSICHVKIGQVGDYDSPTQRTEHWEYVSSITRNLKALTMYPSSTLPVLVNSLSQGPAIHSLQHLTLDSAILTFSSVCSLIEKLPRMSRLMLACLYLDEQYLEMDKYELHDHITGKWNTLSYQLRSCDVSIDFNKQDLAICAMLLAVICPRVTCFRSSMRSMKYVQAIINQTIRKEPFSRYAERLERLGFSGIPEGCETFSAMITC